MRPSSDFDVLVLGELNVDIILATDEAPRYGQVELEVPDGTLTLGSSGAITAAALAALGLRVAYCGTVGDDQLGSFVLSMLSDLGVRTDAVRRLPGRKTGLTVVLSRSDGDRAMLTYPGTMADTTADQVPADLLATVRHIHVSSVYLQAALTPGLPALLAGRSIGTTVSVDPGWDPAGRWSSIEPLLPHVDYLLPNANECRAIAGRYAGTTGTGEEAIEAGARALAAAGPAVAVKLGADGALFVAAGGGAAQRLHVEPRVPVDTTGAGDNFDAGFVAAALGSPGGFDPRFALALGSACGGLSTAGIGGTGRLAGRAEAHRLARSMLDQPPDPTPLVETLSGAAPVDRQDLEYR